jgi:prophage regulatory protein
MSIEAAVRDEVARELHRIMNVSKFGEQIIAERLRDAVLKLGTVSAITGLPSSTLYRKVQQGEFPAPIKLGESASGWLMSEVEAWIAARQEERDAAAREALARKALAVEPQGVEMPPPSPPRPVGETHSESEWG